MEKEISWEELLKIKTTIFLAESDDAVVWENPHLNADYAKNQEDSAPGVNESFVAIQASANSFLERKIKNQQKMTEIEEETKEEYEDVDRSPDNTLVKEKTR